VIQLARPLAGLRQDFWLLPSNPLFILPDMNLLWIDLEMTGLDVEKEVIIEAAAIVTNLDFSELDTYHAIVKQDQKYIDAMDDWNKKTHGTSGLIAKIPSGKDPSQVEKELIALCDKHFDCSDKDGRPVLAGNSIGQDRRFIDQHWPKLAAKLHYRLLDVSSWKIIFKEKYGFEFEKPDNHRALEDIRASIAELKAYMGYVKYS
jgi:oligoribonuclease